MLLAGVLAGCSLDIGQQSASADPTLVVRILRFGDHGNEKVVAMWRLGCNRANGDRASFGASLSVPGLSTPKPEVACGALRDYVRLTSPNRGCSCVIPKAGDEEATVTGSLDGKRVNAGLPYFACRCGLTDRQVRDLEAVTGLK
jgi:hypothetical protein